MTSRLETSQYQNFSHFFPRVLVSKNLVLKKVSVSASKNFSLKKSLSIGLKRSLSIDLENFGLQKSLGIGLKKFDLKKSQYWSRKILSQKSLGIREDIKEKKTFSFGHCPNYLNLIPIRATWSFFFGRQNSRFEKKVCKNVGRGGSYINNLKNS